jgi:hypothetical protein
MICDFASFGRNLAEIGHFRFRLQSQYHVPENSSSFIYIVSWWQIAHCSYVIYISHLTANLLLMFAECVKEARFPRSRSFTCNVLECPSLYPCLLYRYHNKHFVWV